MEEKRKLINKKGKIALSLLFLLLATTFIIFLTAFFSSPYAPEQPINFSHKIHAGTNKIPCLYCHYNARRSTVAGVPPVKVCIGCHQIVASEKPEVQKIQKTWDEQKPIEWLKVYDLPDFVYFSHKRHIKVNLDCSECHGDVRSMERIQRASSLQMGWCMKCHDKKNVSVDCAVCHK